MISESKYIPVSELVELSGLSREYLNRLCRQGVIKSSKTAEGRAGCWLIRRKDGLAWLERWEAERTGAA